MGTEMTVLPKGEARRILRNVCEGSPISLAFAFGASDPTTPLVNFR